MPSLTERIYFTSPIAVQQAMVAAYGAAWYWRRFGGSFAADVERIAERDRATAFEAEGFQRRELASLLKEAEKSPYYGERLRAAGPEGTDPFERLRRLPFLEKETLRTRSRDLLTVPALPRDAMIFRSSGTTGTPTEIIYRRAFHRIVQAYFEARNRRWAGVTFRSRRAMFGVRKVCRADQTAPPFWRFSPVENLAYMSIYHLSDRFMPAYVEFLNRFRPALVMGYPNSLATLARFSIRTGTPLAPAGAIITTSETVTDEIRSSLEQAWSCRVYDNYCAVEACMLATQCEHGRYHVSTDFGIIEILRPDGTPCGPGELGEVICTGLLNDLQPLIRYRIGDVAAWSADQSCPCGRAFPIIERIEGRIEDMCVTADGRRVLRFDTVFKDVEHLREAQVIQLEPSRFLVKVVTDEAFDDEQERRIRRNMEKHVGKVRTDVARVDAIPRTPSGKFKAVVSHLR